MNIEFVGRNFHMTDEIRKFTESKLDKVERFLDEPIEVHVILEVEKHRHIAEMILSHRHGTMQATEETSDMNDAIHLVVDKIEKQARRSHKKFLQRQRRGRRPDDGWSMEVVDATSLSPGNGPRIIESSMIRVKPMSIEEATLELESSQHEFVVFRDSTSERVSVLYRRKDSNYGLISPES